MSDLLTQTQTMLAKHVEKVKLGIAQEMAARHRTASGRSVASLTVEPIGTVGVGLFGGPQWARMQDGKAPGKVPYNFRDIIKDWIKAKGISITGGQRGLDSAAFCIARSIAKNGTRLYREHKHDDIFDSVVERELTGIAVDALGLVSVEVDKVNDKFVKE